MIVVRIVLDTNILIAIIGRKSPFRWLFDAILEGRVVLCLTTAILLEYRELLERKNEQDVAENMVNFLSIHPFVERYEIYYDMRLVEADPDDNIFANCAFTSGSILVTHDGHFNVLTSLDFPKIAVMTIAEFSIYLDLASSSDC